MQEPQKSGVEPVVLQIHLSGRWMPFLSAVTVFALLPALSASAPIEQATPQPLGATPQDRVRDVAEAVAASLVSTSTFADATSIGVPLGVGGGAIDFPGIQLALTTVQSATAAAAGATLPASPFVKRPGFIWPVIGRVMSEFGPRRHPVLGIAMFHTGIDLAAAYGTVSYSGATPSWGQRVILDHDPQLKTGYAHMSKLLVRRGDVVRQGDVIGLVGTTGWSTGCHLHFDVIVNDRYTDPRPYLGLAGARAATVPYRAAPYNVRDGRGAVVYTVEDGDVPIPSATPPTPQPTGTTPTTSTPTSSPSTSSPTTSTPTTSSPTTSSPTTSTPTTSSPTTSAPSTSTPTTTSSPTTTSEPPPATTTTSEPPPAATTTTSEPVAPSQTTTSDPAPSTTSGSTSAAEPTTTAAEPTGTTSDAPPPTSETTPTTSGG
jgi:murein DD-endopeptidase MepM/ murein hydrolase activator NlpD